MPSKIKVRIRCTRRCGTAWEALTSDDHGGFALLGIAEQQLAFRMFIVGNSPSFEGSKIGKEHNDANSFEEEIRKGDRNGKGRREERSDETSSG